MCIICLDVPQVRRLKTTKPRIWGCWQQRCRRLPLSGTEKHQWWETCRPQSVWMTLGSHSFSPHPLTPHLVLSFLFSYVCLSLCVSMTIIAVRRAGQLHSHCQTLLLDMHWNLLFLVQVHQTNMITPSISCLCVHHAPLSYHPVC